MFIVLLVFVENTCNHLKYKQTLKHLDQMHAAMQGATEQDSSMEVQNTFNSQRNIRRMQEIYYE